MDGIQKQQKSILLSFETPNHRLDPVLNLSKDQEPLIFWMHRNGQALIRSHGEISTLSTTLYDACANSTIDRIVLIRLVMDSHFGQ